MPYTFQTDREIPVHLKARLNEWNLSPPRSQFQQYGPLNMFLTLKFDAHRFLVKPQALLREIVDIPPQVTVEQIATVMSNTRSHDQDMDVEMDEEEIVEVKQTIGMGHKSTLSTDSYGTPVLSTSRDNKKYPDFVVTAYRDLIPDANMPVDHRFGPGLDIVRLVIEVASTLGQEEVTTIQEEKLCVQLIRYIDTMGNEGQRWMNYAAGMVISGNRFFAIEPNRRGIFARPRNVEWLSLESDAFINIIKKAQRLDTKC